MKINFIILVFSLTIYCANAQSDTIFTGNERIACSVREITEDAVKYTYPNEDLMNSMYKNAVLRIKFKSGREQVFSQAASFRTIMGHEDWEQVAFTQSPEEVKGLFNLGNVSSKAEGATGMSNMGRVKMTATKKIQIEAAMHGANIIFLTQNETKQKTKSGGGSMPTYTTMTGVAYSNVLPNYDDFMIKVGKRKGFRAVERVRMFSAGVREAVNDFDKDVKIKSIVNDKGLIYVKADIEGVKGGFDEFRVTSFNDQYFNLFYKDKSNIYNIKVKF